MRGAAPTLLDALIRHRRLTRNEARELLFRRAAQMGATERRFALSERQLYRLLRGEVKTVPHPVMCRVLEAEFGYPVAQLLAPHEPTVASSKPANEVSASADSRSGRWPHGTELASSQVPRS
jgi:hypothetical protein